MNFPAQQSLIGEYIQGKGIQSAYNKFFGQTILKTWAELFQLECFFNSYHFDQIIELGTNADTMFLAFYAHFLNAKVYTFNDKPVSSHIIEVLERFGVLWYICDVFSEEAQNRVTERIKRPGRTILYCNGEIKRQAETWVDKLKKDDILLLHGYKERIKDEGIKDYCDRFKMFIINEQWWKDFTGLHIALIKM